MSRVSANTVVAAFLRDTGIEYDDQVALYEWIIEALIRMGVGLALERKECILKVEEGRAALPADLVYLISVRVGDAYPVPVGRDFSIRQSPKLNLNIHSAPYALDSPIRFYASGGYLHFSGGDLREVEIAYLGLALDENGLPLVEDFVVPAVIHYLTYKWFYREWIKGVEVALPRWQMALNLYKREVVRARGDSALPSEAEIEFIAKRIMNNLLPALTDINLR